MKNNSKRSSVRRVLINFNSKLYRNKSQLFVFLTNFHIDFNVKHADKNE